jgi:hypothetical protein
MDKNELASKSVKIFESTYELGEKYKGKRTFSLFIDDAVNFYVKSLQEGDPLNKIAKDIEFINERQATNLGLLCEVLRQAGVLNGNGEINFPKKH